MTTWPASLPQRPLVDGFEQTLKKAMVRTQMEAGVAKQRLRFTAAAQPLRCAFEMDHNQLAEFITFYEDTLAMGTLPFDWTHPITGAAISLRFTDDPPTVVPMGGLEVRVSCNLEILP